MNYTREQAEEVLRDWNEYDKSKRGLTIINLGFLDSKFPEIIEQPETELSRTIKKAEKIVDKLNHLLSL